MSLNEIGLPANRLPVAKITIGIAVPNARPDGHLAKLASLQGICIEAGRESGTDKLIEKRINGSNAKQARKKRDSQKAARKAETAAKLIDAAVQPKKDKSPVDTSKSLLQIAFVPDGFIVPVKSPAVAPPNASDGSGKSKGLESASDSGKAAAVAAAAKKPKNKELVSAYSSVWSTQKLKKKRQEEEEEHKSPSEPRDIRDEFPSLPNQTAANGSNGSNNSNSGGVSLAAAAVRRVWNNKTTMLFARERGLPFPSLQTVSEPKAHPIGNPSAEQRGASVSAPGISVPENTEKAKDRANVIDSRAIPTHYGRMVPPGYKSKDHTGLKSAECKNDGTASPLAAVTSIAQPHQPLQAQVRTAFEEKYPPSFTTSSLPRNSDTSAPVVPTVVTATSPMQVPLALGESSGLGQELALPPPPPYEAYAPHIEGSSADVSADESDVDVGNEEPHLSVGGRFMTASSPISSAFPTILAPPIGRTLKVPMDWPELNVTSELKREREQLIADNAALKSQVATLVIQMNAMNTKLNDAESLAKSLKDLIVQMSLRQMQQNQ